MRRWLHAAEPDSKDLISLAGIEALDPKFLIDARTGGAGFWLLVKMPAPRLVATPEPFLHLFVSDWGTYKECNGPSLCLHLQAEANTFAR